MLYFPHRHPFGIIVTYLCHSDNRRNVTLSLLTSCRSCTKICIVSGCGPVGRALDLGSRCREFESPHSDQKSQKSICSFGFYLLMRDSNDKCNADERCRRRLDRAAPLLLPKVEMQPNLPTRAIKNRCFLSKTAVFLTIIAFSVEPSPSSACYLAQVPETALFCLLLPVLCTDHATVPLGAAQLTFH